MNQNFYTRIRILLTTVLSVFVLQSFASGGEINQTDAKGQRQGYWIIKGSMIDDHAYKPESKVEEGIYLDNRKNGLWKKYWPNGKTRSEINYDHGKPQGEYKLYYENGKLEEHSIWTNSKNTGAFKRYYDNGNPQQDFLFAENGKRNGLQKYYHDNGKIAMEVNIVNGQESGIMRRYNTDGSLAEEKTFENGVLKQGSNKKYKVTETPAVPAKDPYDDSVGKESKVTADKTNKAQPFKPNGFNTLYDKNGQITQIGEFTEGRLHDGKWYRYNSDGLLIRVEIYKGGKYVGLGVMEEK
ncbi:MAG: toxin-antitoxin system YwqK family antitoxin [Flavobacteriales bacterium]|nr:toxin-antitoxin system YwqK family antitoxin [Flavobacteriales bacterium]